MQRRCLHVYTILLYMCGVRGRVKSIAAALYAIAEGQQGYFTARQAADAGHQLGSQAHHIKAGNWVRVIGAFIGWLAFPI